MLSFVVSAKTNSDISLTFLKLAANLAKVQLTEKELEANTKIVKAQIIQYTEYDRAETKEDELKGVQQLAKEGEKKKCTIM